MSTSDQTQTRSAPRGVVPRWEWRTFGDPGSDGASGFGAEVQALRAATPVTSEETYVLSPTSDASVKIRAGLLDVKVLRRVNAAGLQLWEPVVKASFPVTHADAVAAFEALALPPPAMHERHGQEELLREVADRGARVVPVHKRRHRSVLDGCMVECTDITVDGVSTGSVAVEATNPGLILRTVKDLGLTGRVNTCVARGLRTTLGWVPSRYAVLDVGTNSVKFVCGDRDPSGATRTEVDTAVVTRLGEGLAEAGVLSATAMQRTADAVAELVADARRGGPVDIVAVGTAGLRQAPNRNDFVDAVFTRCGVAVEVISGAEEARLAYRAAVSTLPRTSGALLVFDSGGGSSQFTYGTEDVIEEQRSLDVGAVRYAERFGLTGAVARHTVDEALEAIASDLGWVAGRTPPDSVIGIGGTSTNLAAVSHGLTTYDPDVVHGTVLDLTEMDRQIELYRERSADERRSIPGLQPARAEVILAGACIVRTILTLSGQDAMTVSDRGLRHGVLADRFGVSA